MDVNVPVRISDFENEMPVVFNLIQLNSLKIW